ncbi:hypothetical protein Tco_1500226 [Tanacetum coccineum]
MSAMANSTLHYDDILPIIMEKARQDKRKGLQSRLDFGDTPKRARRIRSDSLSSGDRNSPARYCHEREKSKTDARSKDEDRSVFNRLSHRKRSAFERHSNTYSPSTTKSGPSNTTPRDRLRGKKYLRQERSFFGQEPLQNQMLSHHRRGLDGIRVRRRDFIKHIKYKA